MLDEQFESIEYELEVSKETSYNCVTQNLSYEASSASGKEIITVTNNGDIAAEFVEVYVLFFMGDEVVGYDNRYFTDGASEIKPEKSITEKLKCREEYDSFKVFFTGRGY